MVNLNDISVSLTGDKCDVSFWSTYGRKNSIHRCCFDWKLVQIPSVKYHQWNLSVVAESRFFRHARSCSMDLSTHPTLLPPPSGGWMTSVFPSFLYEWHRREIICTHHWGIGFQIRFPSRFLVFSLFVLAAPLGSKCLASTAFFRTAFRRKDICRCWANAHRSISPWKILRLPKLGSFGAKSSISVVTQGSNRGILFGWGGARTYFEALNHRAPTFPGTFCFTRISYRTSNFANFLKLRNFRGLLDTLNSLPRV